MAPRDRRFRRTNQDNSALASGAEKFRLGYTIDPIAVAALLLALASSTWQVVGYFQGAKVDLLLPELVEIRNSPRGYTTVNAQMSYVNSGRAEYSAVIRREVVRMLIHTAGVASRLSMPVELAWQSFVITTPEKGAISTSDDAHPFVVSGASAISHQTSFYPRTQYCKDCPPSANFLSWKDLLSATAKADRLDFQFTADVFGGNRIVKSCSVYVDKGMLDFMQKSNYYTRPCLSGADSS
jgi:hypothetical protein